MTHRKMHGRAAFMVLLSATFALSQVRTAWAAPKSTTPDAIQGFCNTVGGTYFPPAHPGGAYGCLWDHMVIVCGGSLPGCSQGPANTLPPGAFTYEGILIWSAAATLANQQDILDKLDNLTTLVNQLVNPIP